MPNIDKFIRPCEAIKILGISRETLRRNYQKMDIRRTIEPPFLYSKNDCLTWKQNRFRSLEKLETYWEARKAKFLKKTA
jgi:hypothetical protein